MHSHRRVTRLIVATVVFATLSFAPTTFVNAATVTPGTLSQSILSQLASILQGFQAYLAHQSSSAVVPQQVAANGNSGFSAANRIDTLSNTTISNPTITGGSISGSTIVGTISTVIHSALGTIDDLTSNNITVTNATFSAASTTALTVSGTSTLAHVTLGASCSSYGNGGKLTTDALGNIICATDQGGAGSTVAGADTQVQFNDAGGLANYSLKCNSLFLQ
jgi:hypothetical protein